MNGLKGRTAVMSGASGHIGAGAVRALVEGGMNVVMVTHNMEDAQQLVDTVKGAPGKCIALSNENGDGAVFDEAIKRFGSVDVVIPNQGAPCFPKAIADITEEELMEKLHHQVALSFTMAQKAIPYLEKSTAGRIILMASSGARTGLPAEGLCDAAARGAVISMTYSLAQMLAKKQITVNCIAKSALENDHPQRSATELDSTTLTGAVPLHRNGTPDEFGAAVAYLASEQAGFVTGQVLNLCGGLYMG